MAGTWTAAEIPDQSGRLAVVTGATSGIGLETAAQLARSGAHVLLACRDPERGRAAAERIERGRPVGALEVLALDLADLASVAAFADHFGERFERLDLLVNNAGVMLPPQGRTADGFELQFGTNHLGHFALTLRLLEPLRRGHAARVVTVSSVAHRRGAIDFDDLNWRVRAYRSMPAYAQSKLANLLFAAELQRRLERAGSELLSLAAHPGYVRTGLQRHRRWLQLITMLVAAAPARGALPILYAATAESVEPGGYYGPDGRGELRGAPTRVPAAPAARDEEVAARLWQESQRLVGLQALDD
ncbi:MAG: oxidoreductase [bacterium]|nr:oxidoreductase [bacterium]